MGAEIKAHYSLFDKIASALAYGVSSVSIIVFNKVILTSYKFSFPISMVLAHMLMCSFFVILLKHFNLIAFPDFNLKTAWKVFPLSAFAVGNIVLGLVALKAVNIPMFTTLRRLTLLSTLVITFALDGSRPDIKTIISVSLMVVGSLISGWGDLQFDLVSYFFVITNNVVTSLYLIYIKRVTAETQLSSFGILFYNSLLSVPLLLVAWIATDEYKTIQDYPSLHNIDFQISFVLSALLAFFINISVYRCTQVNSPLATSVTGQAKNVITTFIGIFAFDSHATPLLLFGITIGLTGSVVYSYYGYKDQQAKEAVRLGGANKDIGMVSFNQRNNASPNASDRDPLLRGSNGGAK